VHARRRGEDDGPVFVINWRSKSEAIAVVARLLNIGVDAIMFVGNSPDEIAEGVPKYPSMQRILIPSAPPLRAARSFERLEIAGDDCARIDRMAVEFKLENLHSAPPEADLIARLGLCVGVVDRFDEYGPTSVGCATAATGDAWSLDFFVMRCRVLGSRRGKAVSRRYGRCRCGARRQASQRPLCPNRRKRGGRRLPTASRVCGRRRRHRVAPAVRLAAACPASRLTLSLTGD
jgi:hypothetical protein